MQLIEDAEACPSGWTLTTVGEACTICDNLRLPLNVEQRQQMQGEYPYYGPTGVLDYLNEYRLDGTYTLIGEDGDHFLKYWDWPMTQLVSGRFNVNNHAHVVQGKGACLTEWFFLYFHHMCLRPVLTLQGVGRYKLTRQGLERLPIVLPPLSEQQKLVAIVREWTDASIVLSRLISAKLRFKNGLMQQLLTGKRRFPGYRDDWRVVHLRDVAEECVERNRGRLGTDCVMAVTKAEGIVPMREKTIAADIDRYSVVKKHSFAYNPMRINIGSIARWTGECDVLVSPDYVVFHSKLLSNGELAIDPAFLDQYRRSSLWASFVSSSGNGSVRVRIYFDDLGVMKIDLPSIPEQKAIAAVLIAADREIELLRKQLDALKTQKMGLMQKLLTGQVRVNLPNGGA